MIIQYWINGEKISEDVAPDLVLLDLLRSKGCYSVKCGCETTNCGLCTVWIDGIPMLSCAVPALRIEGHQVTTLEGLQEEAVEFAQFMGAEGSDQCGFCNPGFVMNVLAMVRELKDPTEEEINEYLAGNLCRCTGYISHMRVLRSYLAKRQKQVKL
ncbi:MAG: 2Fe-2S iron-sulfur cluster-binding protein [Selenomonadaceae bacterium]